jgi:uncharacterized protein (TIGR00251 family)
MIALLEHAAGVVLPVLAHPRAKRDAILGERAGALHVAVTAPPDKGKANASIQALLAKSLECRSAQISLLSGARSRQKRFLISGLALDELRGRLAAVALSRGIPNISLNLNDGSRHGR